MTEWLERGTCKDSEASSSSPAHGSPEFISSTTLVNSQLVCLRPVGILNPVKFDLKIDLFQTALARAH